MASSEWFVFSKASYRQHFMVLNPQLTCLCPCYLTEGSQGKDPGRKEEKLGSAICARGSSWAPAARGGQDHPWAPASSGLVTQCFRLTCVFLTQRGHLRGWENKRRGPRTGSLWEGNTQEGIQEGFFSLCGLHPSQECAQASNTASAKPECAVLHPVRSRLQQGHELWQATLSCKPVLGVSCVVHCVAY